jgi:hypothetical protein
MYAAYLAYRQHCLLEFFRLEYLHVLTIEVLYLYDLNNLLYLLNLKTI